MILYSWIITKIEKSKSKRDVNNLAAHDRLRMFEDIHNIFQAERFVHQDMI